MYSVQKIKHFIEMNKKKEELVADLKSENLEFSSFKNVPVSKYVSGKNKPKPAKPKKPEMPEKPSFPSSIIGWGVLSLLIVSIILAVCVGIVFMFVSGKIGLIIIAALLLCTGAVIFPIYKLIKLLIKIFAKFRDALNDYSCLKKDYNDYPNKIAFYDKKIKEYNKDLKNWEKENLKLKEKYENIETKIFPDKIKKIEKEIEDIDAVLIEDRKFFNVDENWASELIKTYKQFSKYKNPDYDNLFDYCYREAVSRYIKEQIPSEFSEAKLILHWVEEDWPSDEKNDSIYDDELATGIMIHYNQVDGDFAKAVRALIKLINNTHDEITKLLPEIVEEEKEWREERRKQKLEREVALMTCENCWKYRPKNGPRCPMAPKKDCSAYSPRIR